MPAFVFSPLPVEFDPSGTAKPRPPTRQSLKISQDETGHRYVREAIWKEVHTPEEAFELLHQGQITRATAATDLNATSSRSHSIFTIRVSPISPGLLLSNSGATALCTHSALIAY